MQTHPMPPGDHGHLDLSRIAQDLQIRKIQVEAVVQLLDEGNTIPFITRYRKERTGGLDEEVLRTVQERVHQLRQLADRRQTILRTIESQGKLTDELRAAILHADNPKRLEDLYVPFKPKKRTLATAAKEKGLEPFALALWNSDPTAANLAELLPSMVNPEKELNTPDDVMLGAQHILAELIAESADVRAAVRHVLWESGSLCTSKSEKLAEGQGLEYKDYFQFTEPIKHIPPHRVLAMNRGEKENALTAKLEWDAPGGLDFALEHLPLPLPEAPAESAAPVAPSGGETGGAPVLETQPAGEAASAENQPHAVEAPPHAGPGPGTRGHGHHNRMAAVRALAARRRAALDAHPHREFLHKAAEDSLSRLLVPSLEREIRRELTQRAEGHAVDVFARNLRSKLLAPPLRAKRILAIDPGFRTGCKIAALDETGTLLEDGVIFPHPPQSKKADAKARLDEFIRKHQLCVIAIGNGTGCRETEELVSEVIAELEGGPKSNGEVAGAESEAVPPTPPPEPAPAPATNVESNPPPAEALAAPAARAENSQPPVASVPMTEPTPIVEEASDAPAQEVAAAPPPAAVPEAPPTPPAPKPDLPPAPPTSLT